MNWAQRNRRCEVYLQFDGLDEASSQTLRGEPLLETKLRAIEELGRAIFGRSWSARWKPT